MFDVRMEVERLLLIAGGLLIIKLEMIQGAEWFLCVGVLFIVRFPVWLALGLLRWTWLG